MFLISERLRALPLPGLIDWLRPHIRFHLPNDINGAEADSTLTCGTLCFMVHSKIVRSAGISIERAVVFGSQIMVGCHEKK